MKRKAGILCCSDGEREENRELHKQLYALLEDGGMDLVVSPYLYRREDPAAGTAEQRAGVLNALFADPEMTQLFDLSGGDLANEVLELLDYEVIARSQAELWGYSDLTTILNGIYAKTGKASVLYQIKNLMGPCGALQQHRFFSPDHRELFRLPVRFLRGERMEGVVLGGNIRCLLKLAGTEYFPDMTDKLLLLEANSGGETRLRTGLSQLKQLGAFQRVKGILLGTFAQMEREGRGDRIEALVLSLTEGNTPVARVNVGHGPDSGTVRIGGYYRCKDYMEEVLR